MRESRFACSRVNRRARAAVRVAPLRDTPGISAAAWASPSASPSLGAARRRGRAPEAGCRRPPSPPLRRRARPRSSRPAEPSLDLALERVAGDRGRQERERDDGGPPAVEGGQLGGDRAPLADQQRGGGAGVQGDLEALARLGVDRPPVPARDPRDQRQVSRARDRQQLGRPLDQPEDRRPLRAEAGGVRRRRARRLRRASGCAAGGSASRSARRSRSRSRRSRGSGACRATPPSCRRPRGRSGPASAPTGCSRAWSAR